jgi:hypothetical protein
MTRKFLRLQTACKPADAILMGAGCLRAVRTATLVEADVCEKQR